MMELCPWDPGAVVLVYGASGEGLGHLQPILAQHSPST
jgi:hypothetical protein